MLKKIHILFKRKLMKLLDKYFTHYDKTSIRRSNTLSFIPNMENRRGGKVLLLSGHMLSGYSKV